MGHYRIVLVVLVESDHPMGVWWAPCDPENKSACKGATTQGATTQEAKTYSETYRKLKKHGNKLQVSHFPLLVIGLNLTLPSSLKISHSDLLVVPR